MKKIVSAVLSLIMLCQMLCSCNLQPKNNEAIAQRVFTDSLGRTVEIPQNLTKVAVSGPLAQIVFYSFAPELLVGIGDEWDSVAKEYIPEEYLSLPVLGQLYGGKGELNLEELLASGAEIVVDIGESKGNAAEELDTLQDQTGIPFIHIEATVKEMDDTYRMLGELCGFPERAEKYALYCEKIYLRTVNIMNSVGDDNKAKILYCLGENGCNVIAKGSYHAEIIDMLCNNLAIIDNPSSKGSGNECDFEQILNWNPDILIFAPDSIYKSVFDSEQWLLLDAVQNGKVYKVPCGPYNWMGFPPSVQRYLGMMWLCKILYPEYANYDLEDDVIEYFSMFYHTELTHEQYNALIAP